MPNRLSFKENVGPTQDFGTHSTKLFGNQKKVSTESPVESDNDNVDAVSNSDASPRKEAQIIWKVGKSIGMVASQDAAAIQAIFEDYME